jgi:hypothetical protein
MITIDLANLQAKPSSLELAAMRGMAIQSYANLEQSLCAIFATTLGTKIERAAIVFFKINNARSRNDMLEKLLKRHAGDAYSCFWNSVTSHLRCLDQKRNEIVHWHEAMDFTSEDGKTARIAMTLIPPNYWAASDAKIQINDLGDFLNKCDFFSRLLNMFSARALDATGNPALHNDATWQKIFHEPVIYPPPASHPLLQMPKAPEPPPQSSVA